MSEWINVKDKLPEIKQYTWRTSLPMYVMIEGFGMSVAYPCKWNNDPFCWIEANIMSHDGDKYPEVGNKNDLIGVTHWMPVPELPKDL